MNRLIIACLICSFYFFSCQKPLFNDDGTNPTGSNDVTWEKINFTLERSILNMHATPFQLFAVTENEFVRFDFDNNLLEKRPLPVSSGVKGIPAMSDNIFMRLTTTTTAEQTIEFHLSRNPAQIYKLSVDSLKIPDEDFLEIEFLGRRLGAFKDDGTQFILPAKSFSSKGNFYVFFLFEFEMNGTADEIINVNVLHRVEVPTLAADFGAISNVRYIEGNYYVSSKEGGYRITEDGQYTQIFPQWMLDFFPKEDKIYVTGINSFDLHESTDNGENWERLNQNSALKLVEAKGEKLFTQEVEGHVFKLVGEDLLTASDIDFGTEIDPENLADFYAVEFYNERYYFNVGRDIYFTENIITK